MFVRNSLRAVRQAIIVASFLLPQAALAIDTAVPTLAQNLRAIENLSAVGDQLKEVLTPEVGFPAEYVEHWHAAVDEAFAREMLEADFLTALEAELSEDTRDAALTFDASPIGREMYELVASAASVKDAPEILEKTRAYIEAAPAEENALFVDLFEAQMGPQRANDMMDTYFRAMKTAAEPLIGTDAAEQWVVEADDLRTGYVENHFLATVMIFSQLPSERLKELVRRLTTPEMITYAEQSTAAYANALNAAADRLETTYVKALNGNN